MAKHHTREDIERAAREAIVEATEGRVSAEDIVPAAVMFGAAPEGVTALELSSLEALDVVLLLEEDFDIALYDYMERHSLEDRSRDPLMATVETLCSVVETVLRSPSTTPG